MRLDGRKYPYASRMRLMFSVFFIFMRLYELEIALTRASMRRDLCKAVPVVGGVCPECYLLCDF